MQTALVKLIICLLLLVAGPALTAAQTPAPIQQQEWRHMDPAVNLTMMELANGNFSAAEAGFRKLAETYSQDAESPFFLGVSQLRQNKPAQAVDSFKQALDRSPDQVEARWNLLVAAKMAGLDLGQLDGKYRSPLLAGPWARSSVQSPVRFENIGPSSGTAKVNLGRGSAWEDYDGDGDLDLFPVGFMSPRSLFRNNGDGTCTDVAEQAGLRDPQGGWSGLFSDYNNDGCPDIYVSRNGWGGRGSNPLYRNNGNGTFTDVTKEAGVDDPSSSFTAAWADYDRDGFIDLYVANGVFSLYGELNSLFHNNGDGTFTNVAIPAGVSEGHHSIGCAWGDADNDGYPDLYVVNYGEDNSFYHNNGNGTFSDWTAKAGVAAPKYGFVAFFFDYDHDGDLDLFVSSWASRMADVARFYLTGAPQGESGQKLYRNKGDGTFEDVTVQAGLQGTHGSMAANFGDIDNDGFPEIYPGPGGPPLERHRPHVPSLNMRNGSFVDVTSSSGTGDLCKGHGQTFADFDGDGNLDIYSPCGGSRFRDRPPQSLFFNLRGNPHHRLTLRTRRGQRN